jgi:Ala-tRNA(Pro) deacylase
MPHSQASILAELDRLDISYKLYEHEAVFTAEEALKVCGHIPGVHCKNLFLKDKKDALYLVTAPDEKRVDLKTLDEKIGSKRLSFGKPDLLMEYLGVLPGSVTPLCLINDTSRKVQPVLDEWMMQQELINVHPLINTATVTLAPKDLLKFMDVLGYVPLHRDV